MNSKMMERNLNRKLQWKRNSTRRWAKSNYRLVWGSFSCPYGVKGKLMAKVDN